MTQPPKSRIFWKIDEKRAVAAEMARLLVQDPRASKLQAVLKAQQVLPAERRRQILAWPMVREQIEPYLPAPADLAGEAADDEGASDAAAESPDAAGLPADEPQPDRDASSAATADRPAQPDAGGAAEPGADAAAGASPDLLASRLAGLIAEQARVTAQIGTQALEQALLAALARPALQERLAAVLVGALGQALHALQAVPAAAEPEAAAVAPPPGPRPKVLVAGLEPTEANALTEAFGDKLNLRYWRPSESKDQLRSLARVCAVAVVMVEAVDAEVESLLKSMHLRLIRHSGNVARLKQKLHELVDNGLFNILN